MLVNPPNPVGLIIVFIIVEGFLYLFCIILGKIIKQKYPPKVPQKNPRNFTEPESNPLMEKMLNFHRPNA